MRLTYQDVVTSDGMELEYKYSVLRQAGNKKYARKADDKNIKIVGIKFTNLTDADIHFGNDLDVYADDQKITPLSPDVVKKEVKQVSGLYMLWSLFWITFTKCENDDCSITPIPIGLLIGIGNTAGASGANKSFNRELEYHNMMNKTVKPGQTVKGLLIVRSDTEAPLSVRFK
jgi:hypothetical protein